jgi:hypothetical protein
MKDVRGVNRGGHGWGQSCHMTYVHFTLVVSKTLTSCNLAAESVETHSALASIAAL